MIHLLSIILLTLLLFPSSALPDQKWGKVEPEVLAMTTHPLDPEADAVILFDNGGRQVSVGIDRGKSGSYYRYDIIYTRHRRIKILTESGKEYADVRIPYWHKDKFKKLDAHTILPSGKKIKLDKKQLFEERHGPTKEKVFAFPGVEVGSVIEYRYEIYSNFLYYFAPWYFQNEEFTESCQYTIEFPQGFRYRYFFQGPSKREPVAEEEDLRALGLDDKWIKRIEWKMENVEAVPKEPDMGNIRNYQFGLFFQFTGYKNSKSQDKWDYYAERMSEEYKYVLSVDNGLKETTNRVVSLATTDIEKARLLYYYVQKEIEETQFSRLSDIKDPLKVLAERKGSRIEKNILLINLLRHAELEAYPVLIMTKNRGKIYIDWPQINQFNHMLALVKIDGKSYFLDTVERYCPFGIIPRMDLTGIGLAIYDEGGEIIDIPLPDCRNILAIETKASLNETGEILCWTRLTYEGLRNVRVRKVIGEEKEEKEFIEDMLQEQFGVVQIDTFHLSGIDVIDQPLVITVDYRLPEYAQVSGEMIYLTPPVLFGWESNPYTKEERIYPLQYDYPIMTEERIELSIPKGYRVVEMPVSTYEKIQGLHFTASCKEEDDVIRFQHCYTRKRLLFTPSEYPGFRDFFANVVASEESQLVLGH